jgi:hypothetical protein
MIGEVEVIEGVKFFLIGFARGFGGGREGRLRVKAEISTGAEDGNVATEGAGMRGLAVALLDN